MEPQAIGLLIVNAVLLCVVVFVWYVFEED